MAGEENPNLLARCLFCGYLLEGLPVEHACPECGQAFDRRWEVFGGKSQWNTMSRAVRGLTAASVIALAVAGCGLSVDYLRSSLDPHMRIILIPFGLYLISLMALFRRGRHRVVVGPSGVSILQVKRKDRVDYRWGEILNAERFEKRPMLNLCNPLRRMELMGLGREAEVCMARINERVESGSSQ